METAILLFKQYSGPGIIVGLFLIALVYLWFVEKNSVVRKVLVNYPIVMLLVFFCPIVVAVMEKFAEEGVYWRLLWSIPMLVVITYAAILLIRKTEGIKRYFAIGGVLLLFVVGGDYMYNNPEYRQAENLNHIPAEVMEICDEIIVEGREVLAAFPGEMLIYVPQYTPFVHMPYGREMFLQANGIVIWDDLYLLVEAEVLDSEKLAEEIRRQRCHYVVLDKAKEMSGEMEDLGFSRFYESDKYVVYLDEENDPRNR